MYNKVWFLIIILFLAIAMPSIAQQKSIFSADEFIRLIKQNHPVVKQANIVVSKAQAELLSTKGNFDPLLDIDATRKTFDGKNYYNYYNPELIIPTLLPIDIKLGLEDNGGTYIDPEYTKDKSSYVGVEVALAKGFLIDKRRAALKQAKIFQQQSEQEKKIIINNILLDAYVDYWAWAGAYQQYGIFQRFLDIANNRLRLVRIGFTNGERSAMDTIEAYSQWQSYQMQQAEASVKLANAALQLSNYLWQSESKGYQLSAKAIPDTVQFALITSSLPVENFVSQSSQQNPIIKSYQFKLNSLEIERRLKFQSLLPYFNAKANALSKGYYQPKGWDANYLENNYKWGLVFKMPLFIREGRGDYKKAQLKIKEATLELNNKQWQVENKIRSYSNESSMLQQQLSTIQTIFINYQALLKNEELKFAQGESSLFMINSRETKLLEVAQKQIDLRVKYQKAKYSVEWSAGLLN